MPVDRRSALCVLVTVSLACASKTTESELGDAGSETGDDPGETGDDPGETGETGEPDDRCVQVTPLAEQPCRVLPTGLAVIDDGAQTRAATLGDDGSLTPVPSFPPAIACNDDLAHDPVAGKLWWVEPGNLDAETPPRLQQFDLATGASDWQRSLAYPDYERVLIYALLAHEGGLYLAGALEAGPERGGPEWVALLERVDPAASGAPLWTQIGLPGFGFAADEQAPLHAIYGLYELTGGLGFDGAITGIDSAARTLATVDPATGELRWSTRMIADDYGKTVVVDGRVDLLVWTLGYWWVLGGPANMATTDTYALSGFGVPLWEHEGLTWPGFVEPWFHQLVLDDRVVQLLGEGATVPRYVERDLDGELGCEAELPELLDDEDLNWPRAWKLGGEAVVIDGLLLQPQ